MLAKKLRRNLKPFIVGFCTCAFLFNVKFLIRNAEPLSWQADEKVACDKTANSEGTISGLAVKVSDHAGAVGDHTGTVNDHAGAVGDRTGTVSDHAGTVSDHTGTVSDHTGTVSDRIRKVLIHGNGSYNLYPDLRNKDSFSQYGQDEYLNNLFGSKRNGFFVEIGAYDGQFMSNTLLLEMKNNWTGLLIEAIPHLFSFIPSVNRNCYAINCCLGYTNTSLTFTIAGMISSADAVMTAQHRNRINSERNNNDKTFNKTVTVQCYSLLDVLNVIGTKKVDYFSLDVEGAELYILESIDWNQIDIDVFTIETDHHRDKIMSFMKDHGYKWLTHLHGDDIFSKHTG
ncbi:uncharacterized protein LOC127847906 [Dreissena polymorpha]|uniref:Methyltransferase FkbM domain-containing protein n=1 Tax=Dreissena polymorpha TaxID=45954 RepID=A0A9D4I9T5_DREPO|nr:uncharacterized protein LOC127847906 [Dreissena polymorpha]KAH3753564.1 hypothetical protein DPMN_188204 [Dreissena polymorpha]